MVERTDDQPGTGSATNCSALSLRQASNTLRLAQRSYLHRVARSSCMIAPPPPGGTEASEYVAHPLSRRSNTLRPNASCSSRATDKTGVRIYHGRKVQTRMP